MDSLGRAQEFLRRGWSVIPAQRGGKKPLIEWAEYTNRLPTEEELAAWWTKWPSANIAVVTGKVSGLVAVDVDTDRGGDPRWIFERWPTGVVSRTGSGGFHLFYRYPDGAERVFNRVGKSGIDVRADGGYVIAPPSVHQNGETYSFIKFGELGAPPEFLTAPMPEAQPQERDEFWLTNTLLGVEGGTRNDSCARLAGYFSSKGVARDVAVALLRDWNGKNRPPMPGHEVEQTVHSVYRSAFRKSATQQVQAPTGDQPRRGLSVVEYSSYMTKYSDETVRWAIQDWLPQQTIAFVVSPPGSYKTWMVLDLAESVASGRPFLNLYPVLDTGPVLIFQQEDPHSQVAERLATIEHAKSGRVLDLSQSDSLSVELPVTLPIHFHPDRMLKFADAVLMGELRALVERIRPKLVIIDPLYSAGRVDDFFAKTAEEMFPLKEMRDTFGCSFLIVHHTAKNTEGKTVREALWGSQFLNAFLETGWQIRKEKETDKHVFIHRHFKVRGKAPVLKASFDISTDAPYRYEPQLEEATAEDEKGGAVVKALVDAAQPLTAVEISKAIGWSRASVSRAVKRLIELGTVQKCDDGRLKIELNKGLF